jgi:hypothetical protein
MGLEIDDNTWCGLASYRVSSDAATFNIHGNNGLFTGGAPQSSCAAEEQRILAEMLTLPGRPAGTAP